MLLTRLRIVREYIKIHRRYKNEGSAYMKAHCDGAIEQCREDVRWLIRMIRLSSKIAAMLLLTFPFWSY